MKRLFLAIDLPERIIDDIGSTYQAIHGARWTPENQLHITLRFYGETSPEKEAVLINSLRSISQPPFSIRLKGVGYFPPRGEPRILWVGVTPHEQIMRLASQIENVSVKSGFEREKRNFSPHITVARLHSVSRERVAQYLISNSLLSSEIFEVRTFHLYSSHLGKAGATYTKEASFHLDAGKSQLL